MAVAGQPEAGEAARAAVEAAERGAEAAVGRAAGEAVGVEAEAVEAEVSRCRR